MPILKRVIDCINEIGEAGKCPSIKNIYNIFCENDFDHKTYLDDIGNLIVDNDDADLLFNPLQDNNGLSL